MENPWFGPKADVGSTGILTWQGALTTILGIGGTLACHFYLKNDWATAACVVALVTIVILKYDPDTESY